MTSGTAAAYGVGGALLVACLAAANMPSADSAASRDRARASASPPATSLADDVRSQAERLRARMAKAPMPEATVRNPFAFAPAPRAVRTEAPIVRAAVAEDAPALPPPAPMLTLMGIAEEAVTGGPRRTAVIALRQGQGDEDTILMVTEGEPVGDRYRVTKIGADAVELEDLLTRAYRRIALK